MPTDSTLAVLVLTGVFPPEPGAKYGNFVLDQVTSLAESGCNIGVMVAAPWVPRALQATMHRPRVNGTEYRGAPFRITCVGYPSLPRRALGRIARPLALGVVWPALRAAVETGGFKVIHAHGEELGYVAVKAAARLGIASVVTVHGIDLELARNGSRWNLDQRRVAIEAAGRTILVGSPLLKYVQPVTASMEHVRVISNGFRIPNGYPQQSRRERNAACRVVAAGDLTDNKGFDLSIEAVRRLRAEDRDVELIIVGGGPEATKLRKLVQQVGLEDRVHFTGRLSHSATVAEIAAGDVFCLPSWREACGVVYMEAMALGKPTIGCRGQGPGDFIEDGRTGFLVEPESVESLVTTLGQILADPRRASCVGEKARHFVETSLTWRNNAQRVISLYREVLTTS